MTEKLQAVFKLLPKQIQLVQALEDPDVKIVLAVGAQQSGKTVGAAVAYVQHIARHPSEFFVMGGPTVNNIREATLRKFEEAAGQFKNFITDGNQIQRRIDIFNGSVIYYHTYDQGVKAWEGFTAKAAWIDDAQQMPLDIYHELGFRLGIKQGKLLITARVPDPSQLQQHWLYDIYKQASRNPNGPIRYIQFTAWDNPYYPQDLIEAKRRKLTPEQFQAWVEGRMDLGYSDDHLYKYQDIEAAIQRFNTAFWLLPPELQDFVKGRMLSPLPSAHEEDKSFNLDAKEALIDIGVDVAGFGGNMNVVSYRYGNCVFAVENWGPGEVAQTADTLAGVGKQLRELGYYVRFWPDATGIGASLPYLLALQNQDVIAVKYGENAQDSKTYYNRKGEAYFILRERLHEVAIPPVEDVKHQLEEQRYGEKKLDGRLVTVEQKTSPDHLDALVMSCLGFETAGSLIYVI